MPSVNKVILLGNLGRDPEVRYTPSGSAVCNISLATTRNWKNKESGERQEEVEWHRVVFYDRLAEIAGEYLKKGKPVYIEGRLKTRKWQDKDNKDQYTTEIVADSMQLLGSRDSDGAGQQQHHNSGGAPQQRDSQGSRQQSSGQPQRQQQQRAAPKSSTGFDDMDDDIPF